MTGLLGARREDTPQRRVPGQPDMWLFVLFEALLFTGYFSVYLALRTQNQELFLGSLRRIWICGSASSIPLSC